MTPPLKTAMTAAQAESRRDATLRHRILAVWLPLAAITLAIAAARLLVGTHRVNWPGGNPLASLWRLLTGTWIGPQQGLSVLDIRLQRAVIGGSVGAALSAGGVALQSLLRNPLAEPFILGLSTGAGVGVMAQAYFAYLAEQPTAGPHHVGAMLGALASMTIVYLASRRRGVLDPLGLLLTGVVLSSINAGIIMLINRLVGPGGVRDDVADWMMGYLQVWLGAETVRFVLVVTVAGIVALFAHGRAMDVAAFSDAEAEAMGVNLGRLRTVLYAGATVLAAGAVVLAGPIAFVGLICPHIARLLVGPSHRPLLIASVLLGICLILLADIIAAALNIAFGFGVLPIGVFTSLLGGPAFLWMLRPHLGRGLTEA